MAQIKALTTEWFTAHFRAGTAVFTSQMSVNVTFSPAFASAPKIVATPQASPADRTWWISNKTASGFTINFGNNKTLSVDWIAILP